MATRKATTSGPAHGRSAQAKGKKFQTLTGGEMHGRAGEALPSRERAITGDDVDWERAEKPMEGSAKRRGGAGESRPRPKGGVTEVEYERGPGSRFQIEGRGARQRRSSRQK